MAWTYNDQLATDKDKVRALIGDVNVNDKQVTDEAINVWVTEVGGNIYTAASIIAQGLSGLYARRAEIQIDGLKVKFIERAKHYRALAIQIRETGKLKAGSLGTPVVSGVSLGEMDSVDEDTDRFESRIKFGMHDFPLTVEVIDRDGLG